MSNVTAIAVDDFENNPELKTELLRIEQENDTKRLTDEMFQCLTLSVQTLIRLGAIIRRLESLGIDVVAFEIPNMNLFRRVAHGQMIPELMLEMGGSPRLLKKVACLPITDQRRIANGGAVKVLLDGGSHLMLQPANMTSQQVSQVFGNGSIRNESQQAAWLVENRQKQSQKIAPKPDVELDRRHRGIRVGEVFIGVADLAGYLAQLATK